MRYVTKSLRTLIHAMPAAMTVGIVLLLASCGGGRESGSCITDEQNSVTDATLLRLADADGYVAVDIVNPWDTTAMLCRLALVPRGTSVDAGDRQVIEVPVERSIVSSAVHVAAIDSLGALGAISGVTDAMYIKQPQVTQAIADGRIADVGSSMSPSLEQMIELRPQVILATPYENAGYGVIELTDAVIIPCADYMERTPVGRAEWIKLLGLLYGHADEADKWFDDTREAYSALRTKASASTSRPTVIKETVTSGVWYVPAGDSYQAALFRDAAATYPWSDEAGSGSLQLDFAAVYDRAHDADVWLVSSYGRDLTLRDMADDYELNRRFKAYREQNVYYTDTSVSTLFEETPFSPHLLLREYINIFHPGLLGDDATLRYYRKAE